jgi:hypothetical protein
MTPVVLLASLASLWTFHPGGAEVSREVTSAGGWRIEKLTDRFSGEIACTLKRGDVSVRNGALVLDLGGKTDVTSGRFRIDDGPVRKLEEGLLEVAGGHYPFFAEKETSGVRGKATLPLTYVSGASTVTVQPKPTLRSQTFSLSGLNEAVTAAKGAGCALPV